MGGRPTLQDAGLQHLLHPLLHPPLQVTPSQAIMATTCCSKLRTGSLALLGLGLLSWVIALGGLGAMNW